MSNFRDMVNANIPTDKKIQEQEISSLEKEAISLSSDIKYRILEVAKQHTSGNPFNYNGILYTRDPRILKYTEQTETKYGFIVHKSKTYYSYCLNKNASYFYSALKKALEENDISISPWNIASFNHNTYENGGAENEIFRTPFYLFDEYRSDTFYTMWGPNTFDTVLSGEYKRKWTNLSLATTTKYSLSYKDETYNMLDKQGGIFYACLLIQFSS